MIPCLFLFWLLPSVDTFFFSNFIVSVFCVEKLKTVSGATKKKYALLTNTATSNQEMLVHLKMAYTKAIDLTTVR